MHIETLAVIIAYIAGAASALLFVRGFNAAGVIISLLTAMTCGAILFWR